MGFHRRRHQSQQRYGFLIRAIFAIFGALLLLFIVLSLLVPSAIDENDHLRHARQDIQVLSSPLIVF